MFEALKGWTPAQKHVVAASYLGWMLDAFDFFLLVFVIKDVAAEFHSEIAGVSIALTLTLGLRMEYERGATERYDRALAFFDPTLELPISAGAEAAYARNPIPELPASEFAVRGGPVYAGRNGRPRELWQSELMWLPRISAAWQLGTKTIARVPAISSRTTSAKRRLTST